ncbi:TetR/AcrR family transcriptional regulator [Desulfatirhabdium butyrativorans]|uniref:TetR/AcrR family transcriptional regulator n=1 Tax=Desulfatirhabdium butyrativorans TaxID=340467 RepID=UPI000428ED0F|nr:TetR/AcrR family transcriptional regulator [Desulfatirhabdium butyrativorans]
MATLSKIDDIRRKQILQAAMLTLAKSGSANVTMEDIAVACGLSKGGLAHYYPSKSELFMAVFVSFFDRIFERSCTHLNEAGNPMEKLLSFEWLFDRDDPDCQLGYPLLFDCMALAVHDEAYRDLLADWFSKWVGMLQAVIEEGQTTGLFPGIVPEFAGRAISAVYQGIATRWYFAPDVHSTQWAIDAYRKAIRGIMAG